jgi:hypothetical protein
MKVDPYQPIAMQKEPKKIKQKHYWGGTESPNGEPDRTGETKDEP